ncbi:MAG: TolC family protein [Rhodothermia bacterium]|nr:MAG: TolC family protein [Rhodothermia bacterium]
MSPHLRLVFLIWLVPGLAFGQEKIPADSLRILQLDQIIEAIQVSNPDIQASKLTSDVLTTKGIQVSSLPDPMIMFNVLPFPIYTARGTQRSQFRVEQAVPFPGKLSLKGQIADLGAVISSYGTDVLEDDLILRAKFAFYEIYRLQQHELLIHEFQSKLRDFESVAATQYEVGRGMQQAILKAQLERNTLSQRLLDLAWQRKSAAETLAKLINRPVSLSTPTNIEITSPELPELDESVLLSMALKNRPEFNAFGMSAERADVSIDLAKKMFYPDFAFNISYFDVAESNIPSNADGKNALALGVSVKVPLQRGRLKAQLQEARLRRSRVDAGIESLVTGFRTRIADIISRSREDLRQLELYEQALIPQAETTLEATLSAYTTGRTDFLNLLDSERVLFMVHTGYEDVFARYLKTIATLERELGVMSISEISEN